MVYDTTSPYGPRERTGTVTWAWVRVKSGPMRMSAEVLSRVTPKGLGVEDVRGQVTRQIHEGDDIGKV